MSEDKVPYPFFTKNGEVQSAAEVEAIAHFVESALFYLPQDIAAWPAGIRQAALGFMLQAIGDGVPPFSVRAHAIKAAKEAYLRMFGHGGGIPSFLNEAGEDECWVRDIRARAMQEPLPKILAEYLRRPLPLAYGPRPFTGQMPPFDGVAIDLYLQNQLLSAALVLSLQQMQGPIKMSYADVKVATEASRGVEIGVADGFFTVVLR